MNNKIFWKIMLFLVGALFGVIGLIEYIRYDIQTTIEKDGEIQIGELTLIQK